MAGADTTAPTTADITTMASAPPMLNQRLRPILSGMAMADTTAPTMAGITTMASAPPMPNPRRRPSPSGMVTAHTTAPTMAGAPLMLNQRLRPTLNGMAIPDTTAPTDPTVGIATMESAPLKERERQFLRQSPRLIPNTTTLTATLPLTTGATMASVTTTASALPMLSLSPRGTSAEATTAEATTAAASTASALPRESPRQWPVPRPTPRPTRSSSTTPTPTTAFRRPTATPTSRTPATPATTGGKQRPGTRPPFLTRTDENAIDLLYFDAAVAKPWGGGGRQRRTCHQFHTTSHLFPQICNDKKSPSDERVSSRTFQSIEHLTNVQIEIM